MGIGDSMNLLEENIIQFLKDHNRYITSKTLASHFDVSIRTIKSYIKDINNQYEDLILSSNRGYRINAEFDFETIIFKEDYPRTTAILMAIIQNKNITIYHLLDSFYISESTLNIEFSKIRTILKDFELTLNISKGIANVIGLKRNKRKLLTHILFQEASENFNDLSQLQNYFPNLNLDIQKTKEIIKHAFSEYDFFINDYALVDLLLHILVLLSQKNKTSDSKEALNQISTENYEEHQNISFNIFKEITKIYPVNILSSDIDEISLVILSIGIALNTTRLTMINLEKYIPNEIIKLVEKIIHSIESYYYIQFEDEAFKLRFTVHIYNLLNRIKLNRIIKNPLLDSFKMNSPLIYDCAVNVAHTINQEYDVSIKEDEIGFIAFHIGGELEKQKEIKDSIKAVLYFPTYHDFSNDLYQKIIENNENNIYISSIISSLDNLDLDKIDLIISIHDLPIHLNVESVIISPFYSNKDHNLIQSKISSVRQNRHANKIINYLRTYLAEDHFYTSNKDDLKQTNILDDMIGTLVSKNLVSEGFYEQVLKREALSSTAFGSVAIPHTIKMESDQTTLSIYLSDKGIDWDGQIVKVVILLSLSKSDRKIFIELFDIIAELFTDFDYINKLSSKMTYETFIEYTERYLSK